MRQLKLSMITIAGLTILFTVVLAAGGSHKPSGPAQPKAQDQRPAQAGTIQVRVRLVPVDVIVTDKLDRPVTDLKKEEFRTVYIHFLRT